MPVAKIVLGPEEFERLLQRFSEVIHPRRYYVVADGGSALVLVPLKSSRHLHYYEVRARGESYTKLKSALEQRGFVVVEGEVVYLPT